MINKKITLLVMLMLLFINVTVSAEEDWVVDLLTDDTTVTKGSFFDVVLYSNNTGSGVNVSGWEISQVNFTSNYIEITDVSEGTWLSDVEDTIFDGGTVDNENGTLKTSYAAILGKDSINTGGEMLVLTFKAVKNGNADISFYGLFACAGNEIWFTPSTLDIKVVPKSPPRDANFPVDSENETSDPPIDDKDNLDIDDEYENYVLLDLKSDEDKISGETSLFGLILLSFSLIFVLALLIKYGYFGSGEQ